VVLRRPRIFFLVVTNDGFAELSSIIEQPIMLSYNEM